MMYEKKPKTAEIDPLKFGRLAHTTGFIVRRLHNFLSGTWGADMQDVAARTTPVQAGLLVMINENSGVTQTRLQKALQVESATMVRSISKLIDAGLIEKARSQTDKRVFHLNLTEAGRSTLLGVEEFMETRDRKLAEDIEAEDMRTFQKVVMQLIAKRSTST